MVSESSKKGGVFDKSVVFADKSRVIVACGERGVELTRVQLEGKKPVSAGDWFLGRGVAEGDLLG